RLPHAPRQAASRAPGLFGRTGCGVGVRRAADAAGAAGDRLVAARGRERLQSSAFGWPRDRSRRNAGRDGAADRVFGRASLMHPRSADPRHHNKEASMKLSMWALLGAALASLSFVSAAPAQSMRGLPDFTDLYEQQSPAVVSIDVTQTI